MYKHTIQMLEQEAFGLYLWHNSLSDFIRSQLTLHAFSNMPNEKELPACLCVIQREQLKLAREYRLVARKLGELTGKPFRMEDAAAPKECKLFHLVLTVSA